jgi:hypothetical protein
LPPCSVLLSNKQLENLTIAYSVSVYLPPPSLVSRRAAKLERAISTPGDGDSDECSVETPIFIHILFKGTELHSSAETICSSAKAVEHWWAMVHLEASDPPPLILPPGIFANTIGADVVVRVRSQFGSRRCDLDHTAVISITLCDFEACPPGRSEGRAAPPGAERAALALISRASLLPSDLGFILDLDLSTAPPNHASPLAASLP